MSATKQYIHVATSLPLNSIVSFPKFLRTNSAVTKAAKSLPGLIAVDLKAVPWKLLFQTYTIWEDGAALGRFMALPEHIHAVKTLPEIAAEDAKTTNWLSESRAIDWDEHARRIAKAPRYIDRNQP